MLTMGRPPCRRPQAAWCAAAAARPLARPGATGAIACELLRMLDGLALICRLCCVRETSWKTSASVLQPSHLLYSTLSASQQRRNFIVMAPIGKTAAPMSR